MGIDDIGRMFICMDIRAVTANTRLLGKVRWESIIGLAMPMNSVDELKRSLERVSMPSRKELSNVATNACHGVMIWRLAVSELSYLGRFSYESILERGHRRIVHAHIYPSARAHTRASRSILYSARFIHPKYPTTIRPDSLER